MATVNYELCYTEHIDSVSKIEFGSKTLEGQVLEKDNDPLNRKYKNSGVTGVTSSGQTISITVEASGASGGEITLKVEVDGKKTSKYPIIRHDKNGIYSFSNLYKIKK
jgi:hypothetical protein